MKKSLLVLVACCCSATMMAQTVVGDTIKVENADPAYTLYYKVTNADEGKRKVALVPQNASKPYYNVYPSGDVVIPDSVYDADGNAFAVRSIEANALSNCKNITKLTFEATDYIDLTYKAIIADTPLDTLDITRLKPEANSVAKTFQGNLIKWFTGKNNWFAGIDGVWCYTYYYFHSDKKLSLGAIGGARTEDIHLPDDIKCLMFAPESQATALNDVVIYSPSKVVSQIITYSSASSHIKSIVVPCQVESVYKDVNLGMNIVALNNVSYTVSYAAENGTLSADTTGCEQVKVTATPAAGYKFEQWSDGNKENPRVFDITEDTEISATFVADVPSALDQVELGTIEVRDGRVYCESDFRIYDTLGRDVTRLNGNLNGVYVVKVGDKAAKIVVR